MALRLGDSIVEGYFSNRKGKSTHGVLALEGWDMPLSFSLTGDATESLRGRSFEFRRAPASPPAVAIAKRGIAPLQCGVVGTMELCMAKIPLEDVVEAYKARRPIKFEWLPLLYLEWYSQNGRVVVELDNPVIVLEHGEPFEELEIPEDPGPAGFQAVQLSRGEDGTVEATTFSVEPDDEESDGDDLESHLDRINREKERAMRGDAADLDEEMELGERIVRGEGEYLASLLLPQQLPRPEDVDEDRARIILMSLLMELALRSVAVHLCPHCAWREAYRYVLEELIHEGRVPKEIRGSGWTMNYDYGETCPECIAEIERKFRERPVELPEPGEGEERTY